MIPILALICLLVIIYTILFCIIKLTRKPFSPSRRRRAFVLLSWDFTRAKSGDAAGNYPALVISGLLAGLLGDIVLGIRRIDAKRKTTYFIFGSALFLSVTFLRGGFSYLLRFQTVSLFTNRNRYGRFNYYNNEFKRRQMR